MSRTETSASAAKAVAVLPPQRQRPSAAVVLTIVSGVFVLISGAGSIALGHFFRFATLGFLGQSLITLGTIGLGIGLLEIVLAIVIFAWPRFHTVGGALVITLSIASLVSLFGGFLIGLILGLIGGSLAIGWRPIDYLVLADLRTGPSGSRCSQCGAPAPGDARYCPQCGTVLPSAPAT